MEPIGKLLRQKANLIDIDEKLEELALAQAEFERLFSAKMGKVTAVKDGSIIIEVKSSSVASELRMGQVKLLESISRAINRKLTRIYIRTV